MRTTTVYKILILVILSILTLAACVAQAPTAIESQTSMAVQIPEAIAMVVSAFFVTLLTAAVVYLFEKAGLDLRGYATPLGLSIGTWVVAELQNYINTIPGVYDLWITTILRILVIILAPVGFFRLRSNQSKKLIE